MEKFKKWGLIAFIAVGAVIALAIAWPKFRDILARGKDAVKSTPQ